MATAGNAALHDALLDLMGVINSPKSDEKLLRHAGVDIDRALYPLLVRIGRGPIAIGALAEQVGRDQTTVSRQVQVLERLALVAREADPADLRVRLVVIAGPGESTLRKIAAARSRLTDIALQDWSQDDRAALLGLLRRLADSVAASMGRP